MLTINTNATSLIAQNNLSHSQSALSTSLQRLSSGLRINSAADDAAGLAISTRMSSQINGLNQAVRNANDGVSLTQTADGAMSSISDSLQRMRDLSVQASNATNSASDRQALQGEVNQLVAQINSVAQNTAFNGVKLLDGTFNAQNFQVGANAGQTLSVTSIASASANSLGVGTTSSYSTTETATVTNGAIGAAGITVNGYGVGPTATDGVSSSVSVTGAAVTPAAITANDLTINGVGIGASTNAATLTTAINAQTSLTGVVAVNNAGTLTLTSENGKGIAIGESGTATLAATGFSAGTTAVGSDSAIAKAAAFNSVSAQTGVSASATTASVTGTAISAVAAITGGGTNYIKINGVNIGAVAAGGAATTAGYQTQGNNVAAAINAVSNQTGVTASFDTNSLKVTLSAADGRTITVEDGGGTTANTTGVSAGAAASTTNTYGGIKLSSSSSAGITLGGTDLAKAGSGLTAGNTAATATFGGGISTIDITTASGASNAITTIDAALQQVNASRANLGAIQNRFTAVVTNLQTTSTNLSAAKSRITDTDFAAETANMTRNQILQQAGTAMLAQANALPQSVLSLLK
ncbi:MAG: flagellin [Rhodocyclaceae bacterium]|nr:flagellin [Rhodocyclaceae bacterium]